MRNRLRFRNQRNVPLYGAALQCRVTTEDPEKNFAPDYGKLTTYSSPAGFGIRLDGGTAYAGAVLAAYYDSLLVKVTAWGTKLPEACQRMDRALREFRIRGVKTNIPFLENVVNHPRFRAGDVTTSFLDESPELFRLQSRGDRATKLLSYLGDVILNGNPEVKGKPVPKVLEKAGAAVRPRHRTAAGNAPIAAKAGTKEICRVGKKRKALADYGHDFSRCSPITDGNACAHVRFAGHRRRRRPASPESVQHRNVGRRDL